LNRILASFLSIGLGTALCPCVFAQGEVPPRAKVFKDVTVRLQRNEEPQRVLFYVIPEELAGVVILSRSGKTVARVDLSGALDFSSATGVYDLKGDGTSAIVLVTGWGAKTFQADVYSLNGDHLDEIFKWTGWHFEVVRLKGQPVIAVTPTEYSTLPKLYRWKQGGFAECEDEFPEFYDTEVRAREQTLMQSGYPAYVYAQACEQGATALVYGRKYPEAAQLCQRALNVVDSSPGVIANEINPRPGQLEAERQTAKERIQAALGAIQGAAQKASTNLQLL
jgi:hypothetical protein